MSGKSDQAGNGSVTSPSGAAGAVAQPGERIWIAVFIFGFLGLMVDGMDFMFLSYSLPSLMPALGLSKVEAGSLGSYSLMGMALGGMLGGWCADRYGRVRTVVWTMILFSVGTAFLGLTHNYRQFAVVRFISAIGLGAEYVVCNTLMAEYVPTRRRTTVLGTLQAGWSVGYVAATVLAKLPIIPVYGWRFLFATAIVPVVFALSMQRITFPSLQVGSSFRKNRPRPQKPQESKKPGEKTSGRLFADPRHRKVFILWTLTAGFLQFGYYGVNNWLPTYIVNEAQFNFTKVTGYLIGTYSAMILGKIIADTSPSYFHAAGYMRSEASQRLLLCPLSSIITARKTSSSCLPFWLSLWYALRCSRHLHD